MKAGKITKTWLVVLNCILFTLFVAIIVICSLDWPAIQVFNHFSAYGTDNEQHPLDMPYIGHEQPVVQTASNNNFNDDYDVTPVAQKSGTVRIPVLTYHHVAPVPDKQGIRDYYVSPEMFDQQMAYLSEKNYRTLTPKEFYDQLATGNNPTQKSVLITFDDGNYDNYQYAFPVLKKYGFTGTFYVPSNRSGISTAQLKEMSDAGMVIDPHGKTHMLLSKITDSTLLYNEIVSSKYTIQNETGKTVYSFCYPGCEYNGSVISTLSSNGYLVAFSCGESIDHKLGNRYKLSRMHVYNDMNDFKSILSGIFYYPY